MASDSDEKDFVGFEAEDIERARLLLGETSDESDISVSSSSSSESESESNESEDEELNDFWSRDDSPVDVEHFVEPTGPTSRVPEDGNAMDFFFFFGQNSLQKLSNKQSGMPNNVFERSQTQAGMKPCAKK